MQERRGEGADHICACFAQHFYWQETSVDLPLWLSKSRHVPVGLCPTERQDAAYQKLAQERDVPCFTNGSRHVFLPLAGIVCRVERAFLRWRLAFVC